MRKVLGLLLALMLVAAACGDDDGAGLTDPAEAQSCDDLVDVLINNIQAAIDSVADMTVADFVGMEDGDELPEIIRMDALGDALEARASVLGCSADAGQAAFCARIDELRADTAVARLLLASIDAGC